MVLKGTKSSIFLRNIQLSFFGILFGQLFGLFTWETFNLDNYDMWAWITIFNQAFSGLIVAMVVKYADNILKGFATSLSILISSVASTFLFDFKITKLFMIGASLVLIGICFFSSNSYVQLQYGRVSAINEEKIIILTVFAIINSDEYFYSPHYQ
jgi:UDP-sugar transporter A1/2/3